MLARWKDFLKYSVQYACITHCLFEYVGDFVVCNGPSMEPTLYSKNILLTERISARFHRPQRGDIIIAVSPANPTQYICKRIIGIPGDKITTQLSVSIEEAVEKKHQHQSNNNENKNEKSNKLEEYVPRGYVWIEGDNNQNSADSRYYGPVPLGLVKSRVVCRLWPLSEIRLL